MQETDLRPRAVRSPFGLMADLGAAVAAELGMAPAHIARHLGHGVGLETTRAAVARGRRELAARRINPAVFRPQPAQTPAPQPEPDPAAHVTADALLAWARTGPHRATVLAARANVSLDALRVMHAAALLNRRKEQRRRDQRRALLPYFATHTERRDYLRTVRAWAEQHGCPVPTGRIVPNSTLAAYEAAHAQACREARPENPG